MKFRKEFMFFFDFILPFPLLPIMFWLWRERANNAWFAAYVLLLPLVWGYVFPGIGTNVMKLWRFHGKFLIGNYYLHHGIMYAGPMALMLYLIYGEGPISLKQAISIVLGMAVMQGFFSCQHDIQAIKDGTLEIDNRPFREHRSAEEIVNYFSPLTFFFIGGSYAVSCIYAHLKFVELGITRGDELVWSILFGLAIMIVVPALPWFIFSMFSKEPL